MEYVGVYQGQMEYDSKDPVYRRSDIRIFPIKDLDTEFICE